MNRIIKILVLLLIGFSVKAQVPAGLPSPNNTSYSKIGWVRADSGIINAFRDTTFRPKYIGTQIIWPHSGSDTSMWYWDGVKFFRYLRTGADVIAALGYTPLQNITAYISAGTNVTLSGSGTLLNPYVINASGGGGGGGVNSFAFTNGNGFAGTVLNSTTNPTLSLSVSVTGLLYGNGTAMGATTIGAGLSFSAGTLTNTINNTNQLTNGAGFISNATGLITAGTNITLTGSGTSVSPYVINLTGGGSGITGAGNLSPLFTTSITSSTLNFALTNATAHRFYGNFTGSSAAPSFGTPSLDGGDFFNDGTTTTVLHGNAAGNLSFGKVSLGAGGDANGILDTLKGGTGVASPHFNFGYGILATGNFPNYTVSLDTANLKDTIHLFYNGATGDTLMHSLGGNLYSPRFIDSANFHHYFKADGTLVFYATGGGGSLAIGTAVTGATQGSVFFAGTGGQLQQKNADLFYDSTNKIFRSGTIRLNGSTSIFGTNNGSEIQVENGLLPSVANAEKLGQGSLPWGEFYTLGANFGYRALTSGRTLDNHDYFDDFTSGSSIATLPTAVGIAGRIYVIFNTGAGTTTIATTGGQTINGASPSAYNLTAPYSYLTVYSDGANWKIVGTSSASGSVTNVVGIDTVTTITSGTSSTVPNGTNVIRFNNTSALTYTLTLPTTWHTSNNLIIAFTANGTITNGNNMVTLTLVAGSGQTLSNALPVTTITFKAGESKVYHLIGTVDQAIN